MVRLSWGSKKPLSHLFLSLFMPPQDQKIRLFCGLARRNDQVHWQEEERTETGVTILSWAQPRRPLWAWRGVFSQQEVAGLPSEGNAWPCLPFLPNPQEILFASLPEFPMAPSPRHLENQASHSLFPASPPSPSFTYRQNASCSFNPSSPPPQ